MPLIEQSIDIRAPIEQVYRVSQDYAVRYEWDPFPEEIRVVKGSADPLKVGTQVLVRSRLGMEMVVEFVQVAPPQRAAIKMVRGPWFIDKFAGSWIFESQGPCLTRARFRYTLSSGLTLFAWVADRVAVVYFSRTAAKRLQGLRAFCEAEQAKTTQASG